MNHCKDCRFLRLHHLAPHETEAGFIGTCDKVRPDRRDGSFQDASQIAFARCYDARPDLVVKPLFGCVQYEPKGKD